MLVIRAARGVRSQSTTDSLWSTHNRLLSEHQISAKRLPEHCWRITEATGRARRLFPREREDDARGSRAFLSCVLFKLSAGGDGRKCWCL